MVTTGVVAREIRAFVAQAPELWETLLGWEAWLEEETGLDLELFGPRALELVERLPRLLLHAVGVLELSMVIIGTVSTVPFMLLGAPYPVLLGVLIGLLEILPLVGPWIGGLAAVVVTLFHDPGLALWVALVVVAIQEVEGNLVHPMVMRGAVAVHPFVTLLALLLFGSVFGLLGAVLALPLVLALQTVIQVLWIENAIGTADDEIEPVVGD